MHPRKRSFQALSVLASGFVLALGLVLLSGQASAQEMAAHPAHIHSGTCAELGDVVHPLTDVTTDAGTPMASPVSEESHMMASPESMESTGSPESEMAMGTPAAGHFGVAVATSETIVMATLADLTAGGFAINVHESAENIGNYIACGDITGVADGESEVTIELATLNDSGYVGTATLQDNGDDTTTVTITLMQDQN